MSPSKKDGELHQPCGLNLFCQRGQKKKKKSTFVVAMKRSVKRTEIYEDDPIPIPSSFVDDYATKLAELERDFFQDESPRRKKRCKRQTDHKNDSQKKHEEKQVPSNCVNPESKEPSKSIDMQRDNTVHAHPSYSTDSSIQSASNDVISGSSSSSSNHDQQIQHTTEHHPHTPLHMKNTDAMVPCAGTEQTLLLLPPEVTNIQLYQAVHDCFRDCDPNVASTKSITKAVSRKLGIQLDKNRKLRVTEHLRNLVREYQPNPVELEKAVDQEFRNIKERNNIETIMKKEFIHTLQKIFHVPFGPHTMEMLKQRVAHLLVMEQQSTHESIRDEYDGQALLSENMSRIELQDSIRMPGNSSQTSSKTVVRESVQNVGDEKIDMKQEDHLESLAVRELKSIPDVSVLDQASIQCLSSEREIDFKNPMGKSAQETKSEIQETKSNDSTYQQRNVVPPAELAPNERPTLENQASPKRKSRQRKKPTKSLDRVNGVEESVVNKGLNESLSAGTKKTVAQGRKRSRACTLCSKCPCQIASRDSISSMDLSHSDVAIEKSLIKRLMKLEAMTDKYEEQTEAVRRQLQKHRRDMYRKRMELLKKSNDHRAVPREKLHRFLPDVEELDEQFVKEVHTKRPRHEVSKAQENMFAKQSTNQATLTQMMGVTNDNEAEKHVMCQQLRNIGTAEVTADGRDESSSGDIETIDEIASAFVALESPLPALRVEAVAKSDCLRHRSIWEAMNNGDFDSAWDDLFREDSVETGVDYLLELIAEDDSHYVPSEEGQHVPWTHACLSQNAKTLAERLTDQVLSDATVLEAVDKCCPHWKENIVFVMGQKEPDDVHDALANVDKSRVKLARARSRMLMHLESYDKTLNFFESILQQSLTRFSSPIKESEDALHSPQKRTKHASQKSKTVEDSPSLLLSQQYSTLQNTNESRATNTEVNRCENQINCKLLSCMAKTDKRFTGDFAAGICVNLLGPGSSFSVASRDPYVASQ